MKHLPKGCILRKATSKDASSIRWLVFKAKLDPTQLKWQQFWVIEFNSNIIACGQLRNFNEAQELGSLVVKNNWRNRGLGSFLSQHLIEQATQPLYLECLGKKLVDYYQKFGFVAVNFQDLPSSVKSKFRISQLGKKIIGVPVTFMNYCITSQSDCCETLLE
ncbi:acetyltransferase, N-acetylglutamate synthase [Rivularia sp. PCC 7116]|uniref:GNAT family N-acetyltransferase n=1 Tax=Rivularia sp. PCC 7116 TaxID=373994 RepID=UPI00029F07C9|nr:GNAT family N-acetyltransferase [Rivularia sp. PCC 7116]AFY57031.1 acetyltransferase, N-acetylglutamate synthase [Rivularia sp. PCC 7116]